MKAQREPLVKEVAKYIEEKIAPLRYSIPGDSNGLEFGSLGDKVKGIITCWSPTLKVTEEAVSKGANLIISHELLFYDYTGNRWLENEKSAFAKQVNLRRLQLLSQHNVTVLKYHSNWDIAPGGTADSLGEYLGFKNLVGKGKLSRVYKENPVSLRRLASLVYKKLRLGSVEVFGDLNKKMQYIGTAVGGLGQILSYPDDFADSPAEVLIFGEILEYTRLYAVESGYSCIGTSHEASEMPGMLNLTRLLRRKFSRTAIDYLVSDGKPVSPRKNGKT